MFRHSGCPLPLFPVPGKLEDQGSVQARSEIGEGKVVVRTWIRSPANARVRAYFLPSSGFFLGTEIFLSEGEGESAEM